MRMRERRCQRCLAWVLMPQKGREICSTEQAQNKLCQNLSISTEEPRAGSFFMAETLPGNTEYEHRLQSRHNNRQNNSRRKFFSSYLLKLRLLFGESSSGLA